MSDCKRTTPAPIQVPGLAYFTPEQRQPAKAAVATPCTDLALLEQMYGYFV